MNLIRQNDIIQVSSVIKKYTIPEYAYACHVITQFKLAFLIWIKMQMTFYLFLDKKGTLPSFMHLFNTPFTSGDTFSPWINSPKTP